MGQGARGGLRLTVGPDPDEVVVSTQGTHGSCDAQGQLHGSVGLRVLPGALWVEEAVRRPWGQAAAPLQAKAIPLKALGRG